MENSEPDRNSTWFKSSYSGGGNDMCVECRIAPGEGVYVRHSKKPDVPAFLFTFDEWRTFLLGAKDGEFDVP
ncbi:DUF397 domain-containing protein [Actinokineospora sp.]|uniref:DUF397 domain-containing protein n=1 Tax=Actinokineospora sp. TaxID=1872133 RepID=UPI0040376CAF